MLKKGDILILFIVAFIVIGSTASVWLFKRNTDNEGKIAVIRQNNKEIKKIDLDKVITPEIIDLSGDYENKVLVEKGRIRFLESDCSDLVCVKTGWLTNQGEMSVCLPNRTSIKIEGFGDKVDGVTF